MKKIYGLIGFPLTHSWSQKYFEKKFHDAGLSKCTYKLFPLSDISDLPSLVDSMSNLCGLNVTIPYKEAVIPYLHSIDTKAREIGAINTIVVNHLNGKRNLKGFNTDAEGFTLSSNFSNHSNALVLGSGGASKAICFSLRQLGIEPKRVSRAPLQPEVLRYEELDEAIMNHHTLIVNTTPLGMSPNESTYPPIPYHLITSNHFLYDLVYNPLKTIFLQKGSEQGAMTQAGLQMLYHQADLAFEILI